MPLAPEARYFLDSPSSPAFYYSVTLLVGNYNVTSELDYGSLTVHVMVDSNLLVTGTLDAQLNDPARIPAIGDLVRFYVGLSDGTGARFEGYVADVNVSEYKVGSHRFVTFSAQHVSFVLLSWSGTGNTYSDVPGTPPGSKGYQRLVKHLRMAPDGSSLLSLDLTLNAYVDLPMWAYFSTAAFNWAPRGDQVLITSALLGLDGFTLYAVVDATLSFPAGEKGPRYVYTLGTPPVRLKITGSTIAVTNST